jgi:hypothetical protein
MYLPMLEKRDGSHNSPDRYRLLTQRRIEMPAKKKSSGSSKKSTGRKYGKSAGKTVASAMRRKKKGTLKSGKGGKGGTVKSRKQAIAIGLSEARKKGAKVPKKKSS